MSATTAIEFSNDLWYARLYAGLSRASRMAAELDRPRPLGFRLMFQWEIYQQLGWMNRGLDETFHDFESLAGQDSAGNSRLRLTPEGFRVLREDVLRWHAIHLRLLTPLRKLSWNAKMRKRLAHFEASSERLLSLADWIDAMSTPEEMEAQFNVLADVAAKGDVEPWAAVQ